MVIENFEEQEAVKYTPGTPVELKDRPGKVYIVEEYDPMMVPPIWLVNDPMPHYPHELKEMATLYCSVRVPQVA